MDGWMEGWMDKRMLEWTDGWMEGWISPQDAEFEPVRPKDTRDSCRFDYSKTMRPYPPSSLFPKGLHSLWGWADEGEGASKDNRKHTNKLGGTRRWHRRHVLRRCQFNLRPQALKLVRMLIPCQNQAKWQSGLPLLTGSRHWDLKIDQSTYYACPAFCFSNHFPQVPEEIQVAPK